MARLDARRLARHSVVVVLVAGAALALLQAASASPITAPLPEPARGDRSRPGVDARSSRPLDTALDAAIDGAVGWLERAMEDAWAADAAALIAYLARVFDEPRLRALAQSALARADAAVAARQGLTRPFYRLIDPGARASADEVRGVVGLTGSVTAQALHCDRLPLAPDFWPALQRLASGGGYASTHAVLASVWLQENGCEVDARRLAGGLRAYRSIKGLAVSRDEAVRKLVELLDGATAPTDLRAEALAMLNYAGQPALAGARHVAALLDVQRDDGGWALAVDRDASHPHTTALALWVLLEARHPQRTRAPMISRPVGN